MDLIERIRLFWLNDFDRIIMLQKILGKINKIEQKTARNHKNFPRFCNLLQFCMLPQKWNSKSQKSGSSERKGK